MLVATDFSESSRVALETAIRFFPDTGLSLFHAYDVPFAGYLGRAEVEKQFEGYGKDAADKFLAEAGLTPDAARKVSHLIRSAEHTPELQSLMPLPYPVFCLTKTHTIKSKDI